MCHYQLLFSHLLFSLCKKYVYYFGLHLTLRSTKPGYVPLLFSICCHYCFLWWWSFAFYSKNFHGIILPDWQTEKIKQRPLSLPEMFFSMGKLVFGQLKSSVIERLFKFLDLFSLFLQIPFAAHGYGSFFSLSIMDRYYKPGMPMVSST